MSNLIFSVHIAPTLGLFLILYYALKTIKVAHFNQNKLSLRDETANKTDIIHNYEHITLSLGAIVVAVPLLVLCFVQLADIDNSDSVFHHISSFFEAGMYILFAMYQRHILREEMFCSVLYVYGETRNGSDRRRRTDTEYKNCRRQKDRRDMECV